MLNAAELPALGPRSQPCGETAFSFRTSGERALSLLPIYLMLFEAFIDLLVQTESSNPAVDGVFADVDEAVLHLMLFMKDLSESNGTTFTNQNADLIVGCIRLIGRYLAEVPVAHQDITKEIMPFMISYAKGEAVHFLIPALYQLTGNKQQRPANL